MNKAELAAALAEACGIPRIQAHRAIQALFDVDGGIVPDAIDQGQKVLIPGFGTWQATVRKARAGVSPVDGKPIGIRAKRVVTFKAGKTLRDRMAAIPVAT